MNYSIIKDLAKFEEFIEWLPELEDGQKFYVSLFARRKYGATDGLKADKSILKRFTADKKQLVSKVRKLEVALGTYTIGDLAINQDSLALYITPNPRNMHRAGLKTIQELTKFLVDGKTIYNAQSVALNMIQVSGVKKYFDIDIDLKEGQSLTEAELREWLDDKINYEAVETLIQTKGGFHILVELDKITNKMWYKNISSDKNTTFDIMMNSDNMVPVPGCVQSNFIPKLLCI